MGGEEGGPGKISWPTWKALTLKSPELAELSSFLGGVSACVLVSSENEISVKLQRARELKRKSVKRVQVPWSLEHYSRFSLSCRDFKMR